MPITDLPLDSLEEIMSFLDNHDKLGCLTACKALGDAVINHFNRHQYNTSRDYTAELFYNHLRFAQSKPEAFVVWYEACRTPTYRDAIAKYGAEGTSTLLIQIKEKIIDQFESMNEIYLTLRSNSRANITNCLRPLIAKILIPTVESTEELLQKLPALLNPNKAAYQLLRELSLSDAYHKAQQEKFNNLISGDISAENPQLLFELLIHIHFTRNINDLENKQETFRLAITMLQSIIEPTSDLQQSDNAQFLSAFCQSCQITLDLLSDDKTVALGKLGAFDATEPSNFPKHNLRRADLQRKILREANLSRADLTEANLTGADLTGADLSGADLQRANLSEANLTKAGLSWADLTEANLQWANLTKANLTGADLQRANLQWANLTKAGLSWADLQRANLREADLSGAKLQGANLRGAKLIWAKLLGAKLRGANLSGADLSGANLSGVSLNDLTIEILINFALHPVCRPEVNANTTDKKTLVDNTLATIARLLPLSEGWWTQTMEKKVVLVVLRLFFQAIIPRVSSVSGMIYGRLTTSKIRRSCRQRPCGANRSVANNRFCSNTSQPTNNNHPVVGRKNPDESSIGLRAGSRM